MESKDATIQTGTIIIIKGDAMGSVYKVKEGQEIRIGRDAFGSDVVIKGSKVSRKHISIWYRPAEGGYELVDHSSNGSYVDGQERLPKEQPCFLKKGDKIYLGSDENIIQLG